MPIEIRPVNGLSGIDNNSKLNKVNKKESESVKGSDVAVISSEAKQLAQEARVREVIDKTPDIRQDRINEVKEKLANGDYNNEEVANKVAERLLKILGF